MWVSDSQSKTTLFVLDVRLCSREGKSLFLTVGVVFLIQLEEGFLKSKIF